MTITIIGCPTELGLRRERSGVPSGTIHAPDALRAAGLVERLGALDAGNLSTPPYDAQKREGMLNRAAIDVYAETQAAAISAALDANTFPLILGGDCSLLLGSMRALQRRGTYGLVFLDGHTDFYTPATSGTGGVAGMDLAIACGESLVDPHHVVHLGRRDFEESRQYGGTLPETILDLHLDVVREHGARATARRALERMQALDGFFIHVDVDVLDEAVMPFVDSPQPGGLTPDELRDILDELLASSVATAAEVTIFDPTEDRDGDGARMLVEVLAYFRVVK
ncbi:MAG TPA: arginase family protein [Thermoanaerobaculia bacterium]|nr:arginase family protein [Thermoanaerobaculia bacterium]